MSPELIEGLLFRNKKPHDRGFFDSPEIDH